MIVHSDQTEPGRETGGAGPHPVCAATGVGDRLWAGLPADPTTGSVLRAVGLTSYGPGEGVTTVATAMACAAAGRSGAAPALLIDLSVWGTPSSLPGTASAAGAGRLGLSDALAGIVDVAATVHATQHEGLMLLPPGRQPIHALDADELRQVDKLFGDLRQHYDPIVVDLPCVSQSAVTAPLAQMLDGVLVVVRAEAVDRSAARRTAQALRQAGAYLAGAVLNKLNKQQDYLPQWLHRPLVSSEVRG